ncbi:MAG: preprotein translocase subunit SecE [Defluviitaleaceae bacterium]|nr:preprotein translocase subunit SecE [Defluviitaleaceae bacterium]
MEKTESKLKSIYQVYRAEFKKIVWPSRDTLLKHTITVIAVSLMFGAYIAFNDFVFSTIFRQFVNWIA